MKNLSLNGLKLDHKVDTKTTFLFKMSANGRVRKVNRVFLEKSNLDESFILNKKIDQLFSEEFIPKSVVNLVLERVSRNKVYLMIRARDRNLQRVWLIGDLIPNYSKEGEVIKCIYLRLKPFLPKNREVPETLYEDLLDIEKNFGIEQAENYLKFWLDERGITYEEFVFYAFGNKKKLGKYLEKEISVKDIEYCDLTSLENLEKVMKMLKKKNKYVW